MAAVTAALSSPCERGKSEDEIRDLRTDTDDELLSDPGIEVEDDTDVNGVDNESGHKSTGTGKQNLPKPSPRMDSYRLSMANLESSQDVELDAILGELCALGSPFDKEMHRGHARSISGGSDSLRLSSCVSGATLEIQGATQQISRHSGHNRSSSGGTKTKYEIGGSHGDVIDEMGRVQKQDFGLRTDSPDNDSAFSDNVSMLSSESSASSGAGVNRSDVTSQNICGRSGHLPQITLLSQDDQARTKSEKIKLAMEKIQESHIKRIFIKAYTDDDCAKSLLVDERMTVAHVCRLLSEKIHTKMDPQWAVVERNFDLQLDRIYEDHENLVKNILMWTQDATHKLLFLKKEEKYEVFLNPEDYLLGGTSSQKSPDMDDEGKATLLEEFFSATRIAVPEIEGSLFLKSDGKKAWKKYFFVLRATGLYYNPKGKSKLSKDLVCLTSFEENNVYRGFNWRKKYKSPTDFGFAIKNSEIQIKYCRSIKFLCAEDSRTLKLWMTGIRIAKYGHQLKENYDSIIRDIDEDDLDTLAHARSFSVSSMAKTLSITSSGMEVPDCWEPSIIEQKTTSHLSVRKNSQFRQSQGSGLVANRIAFERRPHRSSVIRRDSIKSSASSSSSGCSSVSTPTNDQIAFEADFPVGTIKRKPSMAPKIPLTSTTRTIAKQSISDDSCNNVVNLNRVQESNSTGNNTLGRNSITRMSLRRSHTEDKIEENDVSKVFQRKHSIDSGTLTKQVEKLQAIASNASVKMSSVDSYKEMLVNNFSDVDDLPLPPPPPELETREEIVPRGILPSPPPEAFNSEGSTLSLDSLPPPPPSLQLGDQVSWPSTSSINSLPPPPSANTQSSEDSVLLQEVYYPISQDDLKCSQNAPLIPPKPKQHGKEYRSSVEDCTYSSLPQALADEQQGQGNSSFRSSQKPQQKEDTFETSSCGISPSAVAQQQSLERPKRFKNGSQKKGISFYHSNTQPQLPNSDISSPTQIPNIYQKPEPPIRSETTRLSHQTPAVDKALFSRGGCSGQGQLQPIITPPEYFIRDLQRVMEKKWKVAQQLSIDLTATPHQIMGFRDPCFLPPESSTVTHAPLDLPDSCHTSQHPKHHHHHHHHHHHSHKSSDGHSRQTPMAKKKAPPPPPKRSESTHLTRR